jgi:hypothetical protein
MKIIYAFYLLIVHLPETRHSGDLAISMMLMLVDAK